MDTQLIQNQIDGLTEKGKNLRKQEALFLRAQGLEEQAEKIRVEMGDKDEELQALKEELAELKAKKSELVITTAADLADKMGDVLPRGKAIFYIDEGAVFLGWAQESSASITPYNGLSGGEKAEFDAALAYALGANILVVEAGEMDGPNLQAMVEKLNGLDVQVLVNSWHAPETLPDGWNINV